MERHIVLLILLFLTQYFSVFISSTPSNETDKEALLAFQNHIISPSQFLANNWTKKTTFYSWFGVTCSLKRQKVVAWLFLVCNFKAQCPRLWPISPFSRFSVSRTTYSMVTSLMNLATCLAWEWLIFKTISCNELFQQDYFNTQEFKSFHWLTINSVAKCGKGYGMYPNLKSLISQEQ